MSPLPSPPTESLFPKCSPSQRNNKPRRRKKPSQASSSAAPPLENDDVSRREGALVDLLVDIEEEETVQKTNDEKNSPDSGISRSITMEDAASNIYGSSAFNLPSCSSESSSSGASSISSASTKRILSDLDIGTHRDSKIEIAGGREIFSQSKSRSNRAKRSSGKSHHHHSKRSTEGPLAPPSSSSTTPLSRHQVLRETVFSSEIHSIEYHRPLIPLEDPEEPGSLHEHPCASSGTVVGDVNVTYDLIDGIFSPPSGLVVRPPEEETSPPKDLLSHTPTGEADYVDTLYLGEEASAVDKKESVMIGGVTIAEYEGSPRRYRPRPPSPPSTVTKTTKASAIRRKVGGSPSSCSSTSSSTTSLPGLRTHKKLPGFPQRILPMQEETTAVNRQLQQEEEQQEELLKFEDVPCPPTEVLAPSSEPISDYDTRYEFSETRKVLEEFFKDTPQRVEEEEDAAADGGEEEAGFGDLDYTLKRRRASVEEPRGGQVSEGPLMVTPLISPSHEDLLLGGGVSSLDPPPAVGHSPLDPRRSNGYFGILSNGGGASSALEEAGERCRASIPLEEGHGGGLEGSRNFTLSPETTDCDSADLESEVSAGEGSINSSAARIHLPVLEDGLSSGHASDLDDDVIYSSSGNVLLKKPLSTSSVVSGNGNINISGGGGGGPLCDSLGMNSARRSHHTNSILLGLNHSKSPSEEKKSSLLKINASVVNNTGEHITTNNNNNNNTIVINNNNLNNNISNGSLGPFGSSGSSSSSSNGTGKPHQQLVLLPPSTPIPHESRKNDLGYALEPSLNHKTDPISFSGSGLINQSPLNQGDSSGKLSVAAADESVAAALKDIKKAIQAARVLQSTRIPPETQGSEQPPLASPSQPPQGTTEPNSSNSINNGMGGGILDPWILRTTSNPTPPLSNYDPSASSDNSSSSRPSSCNNNPSKEASPLISGSAAATSAASSNGPEKPQTIVTKNGGLQREQIVEDLGEGDMGLGVEEELGEVDIEEDIEDEEEDEVEEDEVEEEIEDSESDIGEERVPTPKNKDEDDLDTDQETDRLLGQQYNDDNGYYDTKNEASKKKASKSKEALSDPKVLIEGVLFRARYLGSTQLVCEGQPTKATRMMQAEEAVSRIKAPDGENQPSTEVDLFISTEKIMVLNTDLKEIMMDHALRSISYIADIGDILVIMARRRIIPTEGSSEVIGSTPKMICHVFESEEAQFIAQSIGQAFQVAYMEFLKANGIEDHSFVKEMDYQEVLNSQEIFGDELAMFAKKELQKEVVVPKTKGEILGVVIVESGWGSMLPTIVLANLSPTGPAARCGHLNIGDQIIAINGISLVGLPLSTCQHYIKNTKNKTAVKLTAVSCAPVVEVKIKRPDTKYQLGFSVQNGVICSLLRGGIAERGGVRVGHRIIEINGQSVVAVPHERIVNLLATSVGEITMKTMPTSMFRLLTGQETPLYI